MSSNASLRLSSLFVCGLGLTLSLACGDDGVGSGSATMGSSDIQGSSAGSTAASDGTTATTQTNQTSGGGSESATSGETTTGSTSGMTTATATTGDTTSTTGEMMTGGVVEGFEVGFDVVDVSPTPAQIDKEEIYMGAYGAPFSRGPAQGVHDRIYVRSMAIEAEGVGFVMAIVDLPGMGNQNTRAIREMVADMSDLEESRVLVGSTHTHSSPDLMGLWGGVPDEYRNQLREQVALSIVAAWEAREEAELYVASGTAPNLNRRGWEFTDDAMIVLDARAPGGERIGTLVNFAAHPIVLGESNKEISCDYTGPMVLALEEELGAPVALFNGVLGDASPDVPAGDYKDEFEQAVAYGELLSGIAAGLVADAELIEPTVTLDYREWTEKVDNVLFQAAAQLGILQYDFDLNGFELEVVTQSTYFRLGTKVQGIAFPGESLTRNGLAIKETMTAPHRMILGNTGDALGYFIPSDEWQTGKNDDYEETVSLGKSAGDNARDVIVEMITADADF